MQEKLGPWHPTVGASCRSLAELTLVCNATNAAALRSARDHAERSVAIANVEWSEAEGVNGAGRGWFAGRCWSVSVFWPKMHAGHVDCHGKVDVKQSCNTTFLCDIDWEVNRVVNRRRRVRLLCSECCCHVMVAGLKEAVGLSRPRIRPPHHALIAALELVRSLCVLAVLQRRLGDGLDADAHLERALQVRLSAVLAHAWHGTG